MAFSFKSALQGAQDTLGMFATNVSELPRSTRELGRRVKNFTTRDLNPRIAGALNLIKKDPLRFTPLSMREQAVPLTRQLERSGVKSIFGLRPEDAGYFLRGAAKLTPLQRPGEKLQATAPTTERQKLMEGIGTDAFATVATAGIGGGTPLANVAGRLTSAGLLGGGFQVAGNLLEGNPLTQDLGKGVFTGARKSYQLAITNAITDKIAGAFLPTLTSRSVGQGFNLAKNPLLSGTRNKLILNGIKRTFQRALLETPVEAGFYSILDRLSPEKQEKFTTTLQRNLLGSLMGNVAFAGIASAMSTGDVLTKPQRDQLKDLMHRMFDRTVDQLKDQSGFVDFDVLKRIGQSPTKAPELKTKPTKDPTEQIGNLYDYQNKLRQMGYTEGHIRKISAREAQDIFKNNTPPFEHPQFDYPPLTEQEVKESVTESVMREVDTFESGARWKQWIKRVDRALSPLKYAPEDVRNNVSEWKKERYVSNLDADKLAQKYKHIPAEDGWQIIKRIQDPSGKSGVKQKYAQDITTIQADFKNLRDEALKNDIDVGYLDNYVFQRWDNNSKEIAKALNLNPSFSKERTFKTYKEGMEMGLEPLFTHPGQLVAEYKRTMDNAISNKKLFNKLIAEKYVLPQSKAPAFWEKIEAPYFPQAVTRTGLKDKTIERVEPYMAPKDIADSMNGIFSVRNDGSLINSLGNVSAYLQNVRLAAGVPMTPVNSFAIANYLKELTAGNVVSPTKTFLRSFSGSASEQYFKQNLDTVEQMRKQGINISSGISYRNAYENVVKEKGLKDILGDAWHKGWDEPTFRRLLPMLQIDNFKNAKKQGMTDAQASKVVKNFYGLMDDLDTGRSARTQDWLKAVAFAPRFREAMINFWGNNIKAFTKDNITNPSYNLNRRFMVGTGVTLFLFNLMNKKTTGHWMWENKPGKEMELEIPLKGGRSAYIPVMSSIMTIPRRVLGTGSALAKGDLGEAGRQVRTLGSGSLQLISELLSNRTWYGGSITNPENSAFDNMKAWGSYVAEQTLPYVGEAFAYAGGRKTALEAAIGATEAPIRFSASSVNQRNVKKKLVDALLKNDQDKVSTLASEAVKYSVESKDVIKRAVAEALANEDTEALDRLLPMAQKLGISTDSIKTEARDIKFPSKEKKQVRTQIAKLLGKSATQQLTPEEVTKMNELLVQAEQMGITKESIKKEALTYK